MRSLALEAVVLEKVMAGSLDQEVGDHKISCLQGGIPFKYLVFRKFQHFNSKTSSGFHSMEKWLHYVLALATVNVCEFLQEISKLDDYWITCEPCDVPRENYLVVSLLAS